MNDIILYALMKKAAVHAAAAVYPTETASGNPASFDDGAAGVPLKSLEASVSPSQELNGYSVPWAGWAGKNLLPIRLDAVKEANEGEWEGDTLTKNGVEFSFTANSAGYVTEITVDGTAEKDTTVFLISEEDAPAETFGFFAGKNVTLNGCPAGGGASTYRLQFHQGEGTVIADGGSGGSGDAEAAEPDKWGLDLVVFHDTAVSSKAFYPMLRLSTVVDDTFAPFENYCPVIGNDTVVAEVSANSDMSGAVEFECHLGKTVYAGTVDLAAGEANVTKVRCALDGETAVTAGTNTYVIKFSDLGWDAIDTGDYASALSSHYIYKTNGDGGSAYGCFRFGSSGGSATLIFGTVGSPFADADAFKAWLAEQYAAGTPVEVCYTLAVPIPVKTSPNDVLSLLGQNYVTAGDGSISVTYRADIDLYIAKQLGA